LESPRASTPVTDVLTTLRFIGSKDLCSPVVVAGACFRSGLTFPLGLTAVLFPSTLKTDSYPGSPTSAFCCPSAPTDPEAHFCHFRCLVRVLFSLTLLDAWLFPSCAIHDDPKWNEHVALILCISSISLASRLGAAFAFLLSFFPLRRGLGSFAPLARHFVCSAKPAFDLGQYLFSRLLLE